MTRRALLPASLLLVLAACRQPAPAGADRPYTSAEEGLTLVYLNPSLPPDQQQAKRLQVRVDQVIPREDGAQVVLKSFTVGITPPFRAIFVSKDGGVGLLSPDGRTETPVLPSGFPEGPQAWTRGGVRYRILGRGAWADAGRVLPATRPAEGIWVEADPDHGSVTRTLYLPGLGEVQSEERSADGRWVTVNLLTQYGFTDLPASVVPELQAPSEAPAKPEKPRKPRKG